LGERSAQKFRRWASAVRRNSALGRAQCAEIPPLGARSAQNEHALVHEILNMLWCMKSALKGGGNGCAGRRKPVTSRTRRRDEKKLRASTTRSTLARHDFQQIKIDWSYVPLGHAATTRGSYGSHGRRGAPSSRLGGQRQRRANSRFVPPSLAECWLGPRTGLKPRWLRRTPV